MSARSSGRRPESGGLHALLGQPTLADLTFHLIVPSKASMALEHPHGDPPALYSKSQPIQRPLAGMRASIRRMERVTKGGSRCGLDLLPQSSDRSPCQPVRPASAGPFLGQSCFRQAALSPARPATAQPKRPGTNHDHAASLVARRVSTDRKKPQNLTGQEPTSTNLLYTTELEDINDEEMRPERSSGMICTQAWAENEADHDARTATTELNLPAPILAAHASQPKPASLRESPQTLEGNEHTDEPQIATAGALPSSLAAGTLTIRPRLASLPTSPETELQGGQDSELETASAEGNSSASTADNLTIRPRLASLPMPLQTVGETEQNCELRIASSPGKGCLPSGSTSRPRGPALPTSPVVLATNEHTAEPRPVLTEGYPPASATDTSVTNPRRASLPASPENWMVKDHYGEPGTTPVEGNPSAPAIGTQAHKPRRTSQPASPRTLAATIEYIGEHRRSSVEGSTSTPAVCPLAVKSRRASLPSSGCASSRQGSESNAKHRDTSEQTYSHEELLAMIEWEHREQDSTQAPRLAEVLYAAICQDGQHPLARRQPIAPPVAIAKLLFTLPLFRGTAPFHRAWGWCIKAARGAALRHGRRYQPLYTQGAPSNGFVYVILHGGVTLRGGEALHLDEPTIISAGGYCGVECLVSESAPRQHTCVWRDTGGAALSISRDLLLDLIAEPTENAELTHANIRHRMACLVAASIGDGLSPKQLYEAASRMKYVEAAAGQRLYSSGQPCNKLYVVIDGKVKLYSKKNGGEAVLDTSIEGEFVLLGLEAARARGNYKESAEIVGNGARLLVFASHELAQFQRMLPGLLRESFRLRQIMQSFDLAAPLRTEEWTVDGYRELLKSCHWTNFIRRHGDQN